MKGWIKIHRQLTEWEWYSDINVKVLFLHLLLVANYSDKRWRGIELKKGSIISGISKLSAETGLSVQNVRTALKKLQLTNEITIKTNSQGTVIQIVMFDNYQFREDANKPTNKPLTNDQQAANKRLTTIKEDKKEEEEDIKPYLISDYGKVYKTKKDVEEAYKTFIGLYNKITNQRKRFSNGNIKNFEYWLKVYPPKEILQAVKNHDKFFWADVINPEWLFRQRNGVGSVDYIGELLSYSPKPKMI